MAPDLALASASPRRADLLRQIGIPFVVAATDADETPPEGEPPDSVVVALARRKAAAAAVDGTPQGWVLAADTLVEGPDRSLLGKPRDDADARATLRALSGRTHRVHTGVAVLRRRDGAVHAAATTTHVTFAELSPRRIDAYVASGEPTGKAGAYAIQGLAGAFVTRIEGDHSNVVGLPLATTVRLLADAGLPLPLAVDPA